MCVSGDTRMPTSSVVFSVYFAGQEEHYQATPHGGGHISSTTTSDTFPEAAWKQPSTHPQAKKQEEQWQQYYQSHCPPGGRMSSTNTSEVFGDDQTRAIPPGSYNPNVTPQHPLHKVHHSSLPNYNRQSSIDQPVDRRRTASDVPQSTRPMNNYGHSQHETRPATVQEGQPLERNLYHEFTEPDGSQTKHQQQQYSSGDRRARHQPPPQHLGQYDTWHGPHPQDQQIVQSSQQGSPRPSPPRPPPPRPPPPQQQEQHQLYEGQYGRQQNLPQAQDLNTAAQPGLPSSQAQGNIQSRQQPHPSMYQPTTAHQILQQPQVATTPQFPVISVIQVDQQIHIHQQKLFELQQLQQQMLLRQQYEQLLQVQQQVQLESQKLQQVLTFRRQLQQPPQTEQQWKPNLQSQHLQTQQPGEPPQQHGYHQKQSDNRQTVGDQPEQQFSHQATGHDVYQSHQRPPPAPNQPVNLIQPNDHQITMHGTQQGTTHDREQDTMYEAQQGTSQWGTTYVAQHTSTTTTQSQFPPQEQASRPGQSSQHKPTSEACYMEDVQTQLQHKLTIQEHQTTTEPNVDGRIPPPHQPTGSTQQKHTQSSMVSSHEKRSQIDILKDELKILEEKQQVMEQLRKLQEQINNQSSQGEILQAKGNQLTEVGFSHEESQGDSQQGNSIHSPVTCQHDRESQELLYSEQSSNTAFQSLAITCQPLIDSQDAKYHGDAASSLQKDGPPRRATSSGVSHQDTEKNDGIPPATVTPTNIAAPFTSSVTHTPSTTSGEVITDNATPVAGTSVVTTTTTRLHSTSSVSSTASGSSHVDSEVHGTDEKTTSSSATTSTASGTTTSDRSATHSHSTINILFVKPSTTAQSGTTDPVTTVSLFSTMTASLSSSASTDSRVSQSDQQEQSVTNESTLSPTTDTSVLSTTTNMVSATQAYSTSSSLSSSATNTIMGEEIDTDDAPKNLKKGDHLGSGSFGKVYKCFCKDTGEEIAAKVIEIHPNLAEKELVSLEKEINMLKDLQHDRIVVYHGTRRSKTSVEIYMEYMPGGSLRKFLKDHGVLNENLTRKYTRQLLEGVVYLHSQNIVHRDIKGDNVLRDSKGNVKIADFGTCKRIQTIYLSEVKASTVAGTYHWMAPEVFKCEPSTIKSDVWSVGCTVFEMLTGNPPYYELGQYQLIFLVGNDDPMDIKLPSHCSNVVHDFVTTCLRKNASSRPTAEELLCHEFLNPSLPHCASAAPKLVTAKPSTKQPVAEHTTVTTTHGSAIQQSTPDADPTDQALSATNATSTKGTSTTAERNIANNQSLTKHPVPCTSVTADNAKKWSAVHHPTLESSSDHQVTTDQSPLTTGTDTSEDYTDSDNIMDNNSGGKQLPKTVASPSNTDKHKRPSLHLQMRKMSDSKAAIVEMVSDIPSTPISESTPVVKKYYIMNHPQFHVTDYKGCQLISMTNTGQQFPIDFPKGVNFNLLQPYSEDIINGINVNTIVPPMLAHGLLTPEHCEYFFNPHVISTEKQRKLGFLIITLSEECAQKYLQCLKNTRDYAPHGALLKKIEDGLKSSEK